jgi:hypothetical protein
MSSIPIPSQLLIEMAPLDPTFAGTPQKFADKWLQQIRIVSPFGFLTFVVGDVEPRQNVGPWLKGGLSWRVWDSVTRRYVPLDVSDTPTGRKVDALNALVALVFDSNGKLRDGVVWRTECLADRIVTQPKLHWNSCFYVFAAGATTYTAALRNSDGSIATPALGDGVNTSCGLLAKFQYVNAAGATLALNGGPAYPIRRDATVAAGANELQPNRIYQLAFDGTGWQVINFMPAIVVPAQTRKVATIAFTQAGPPWQLTSWAVSDIWTRVPLTSIIDPDALSLDFSGDQFTLPAGEYRIQIFAGSSFAQPRLRLYDVSNSRAVENGSDSGDVVGSAGFPCGSAVPDNAGIGLVSASGVLHAVDDTTYEVQAITQYYHLANLSALDNLGPAGEALLMAVQITLL